MSYFITGATGFIGRYLVRELLERDQTIYVLVRPASMEKFAALKAWWGDVSDQVVPITGDLSESRLGVDEKNLRQLTGKVEHVFHLAAIYNLAASAESQDIANILGTDHAIEFADTVQAGRFHFMSSIASAGLYRGIFREDMFEEATHLEHPYFRTKHESEGLVRAKCKIPWRIYRPGMVVGHSKTGEIDKIDGPYYLFKMIQKIRQTLPSWMPIVGIEGGYINLVPVDYVAAAVNHIAHAPNQDKKCFHLTDPKTRRVGEVFNLFASVAHAPEMSLRIDTRMFSFMTDALKQVMSSVEVLQQVSDQILDDFAVPKDVLQFLNFPTRFDNRQAEEVLRDTEIRVPELEHYAWRLWDYWERHLDPDLLIHHSLENTVKGKSVLITGGSSGIGEATAFKLAQAGARVLIVARHEDQLREVRQTIEQNGGVCHHYCCDLADAEECAELVTRVLEEHGTIDVLINNAGRSIRRSINLSYDRFHDYERCMQLNFYGSLRLTLGLLPSMVEHQTGHVINISSIGVLSNAPRFSAYVSSKAALEAFSRCAAAEFRSAGVAFTTINMPLVRTPMIAPTKIYEKMPTISPEEAADLVVEAIIHKPQRLATGLGIFAQILHLTAPKISEIIMNTAFRMFPESGAEQGKVQKDVSPSPEQEVFATIMRGVHW